MKRFLKIFMLLCFGFMLNQTAKAQQSDDTKNSIVFTVSGLVDSKDASDLELELKKSFGEKMKTVTVNFSSAQFIITPAEHFNAVEILEFFKSNKRDAYFVEDGMKKMLSKQGQLVVSRQTGG